MTERSRASTEAAADQRESMLLPLATLVNLFGNGHLDVVASGGDLTRAELEREVQAVGAPLRPLPEEALPWLRQWLQPVAVPGTDPVEYEVLVPLWTETGMAARAARVRLVPTGFEATWARRVVGFEDVTPPPEVAGMAADPKRRPVPPASHPQRPLVPVGNPIPERWRPLLREVVERLVAGDYQGLERDGVIGDPRRGDMVRGPIEAYHDALVPLPDNAWHWSHHSPRHDGPGSYAVTLSMWTSVEGVSDLTMVAEVHDDGAHPRVVVGSVHLL